MANLTKLTANARASFLDALSETANVTRAAQAIGVSRFALYDLRKNDPDFAAAWSVAQDLGTDALEDEAVRRAAEGTLKPVFQGGQQVGHVREYSDTLMVLLLKARRPERFKDRVANEHSGPDGIPLPMIVLPSNGREPA